jgi:BirA family transcriptional regulator, biotin operon repressor / biotin---[acetyl-CoA-carboxylase] ligase
MKPLTHRVLRLLADGNFRSGEMLAGALDVSRTTVWQAVRELEATGLAIYKVRGRGYRLAQPLSMLDRNAVVRHLGRYAGSIGLEVVDSLGSTNTLLLERAAAGAPSATAIAAEWQSSGRGRLGRSWYAAIGGSLTFSLLWRFVHGAGVLGGLSLAVGVALARAFEALGVVGAGLKWPNDVVWKGGKLAGILIEMRGDALGPSAAVIGVGVNVRLSDAARSRIDQAAADLEGACGKTLDRSTVLALLLSELHGVLETFACGGFAPLRAEWQRRHAYQDRPVTVVLPDSRHESGIACGVTEDGALLLATPAGVRRYHSGEITLRGPGAQSGARDDRRQAGAQSTGGSRA